MKNNLKTQNDSVFFKRKEGEEMILEENVISEFKEEYSFLSNAYESSFCFNGIQYRNAESAFQAQKTLDEKFRRTFSYLSAREAKSLGQNLNLRKDWQQVKTHIMLDICYAKFATSQELAAKLLETGDLFLIAGNYDKFWGICDGEGQNVLGSILMEVREMLRK